MKPVLVHPEIKFWLYSKNKEKFTIVGYLIKEANIKASMYNQCMLFYLHTVNSCYLNLNFMGLKNTL